MFTFFGRKTEPLALIKKVEDVTPTESWCSSLLLATYLLIRVKFKSRVTQRTHEICHISWFLVFSTLSVHFNYQIPGCMPTHPLTLFISLLGQFIFSKPSLRLRLCSWNCIASGVPISQTENGHSSSFPNTMFFFKYKMTKSRNLIILNHIGPLHPQVL